MIFSESEDIYYYNYAYKLLPKSKDLWVCPICYENLIDSLFEEDVDINYIDPLEVLSHDFVASKLDSEEVVEMEHFACFGYKEELMMHAVNQHGLASRVVRSRQHNNLFKLYKLREQDGMLQRYWSRAQRKRKTRKQSKRKESADMRAYWKQDCRVAYFIELLDDSAKIDVEDEFTLFYLKPNNQRSIEIWKQLTEEDDDDWITNEIEEYEDQENHHRRIDIENTDSIDLDDLKEKYAEFDDPISENSNDDIKIEESSVEEEEQKTQKKGKKSRLIKRARSSSSISDESAIVLN